MNEYIKETSIPGLLIIERPTFADERGFFHEVVRIGDLETVTGKKFNVVQWSHSYSLPGAIRAIHSEYWQKVVYPVTGIMFAAFVDLRPENKTFGKVEIIRFDNSALDSTHKAVYIPPGVGNSICVEGDIPLHYLYAVDEYWDNSKARGIAWDDPDLNINWPIKNPIMTERDKNNPTLREAFPDKFK